MSNLKLTDSGVRVLRRNEERLYSVTEAMYVLMKLGYLSIEEWRELRSVRHGVSFTVEVTQQLSVLTLLAEGYDSWSEGELAAYRRAFAYSEEDSLIFHSSVAEPYMVAQDYELTFELWKAREDFYSVRQMFAGFLLLSEGYDV